MKHTTTKSISLFNNQTCKSNKHMYVCKSSFCDAILLFYNENEFCNQVYVIQNNHVRK